MNLLPQFNNATAPTLRRCQRAFTMIEIAIALGVIGFALVAIVGVLPYGLNVQKDNREETILSQDSQYFMEAIKGGAMELDHLTNFVDWVCVSNTQNGNVWYTSPTSLPFNGTTIISFLSHPRFLTNNNSGPYTITAQVRALSGSALDQHPDYQDVAFKYLLTSELISFGSAAQLTPVLNNSLHEIRFTFSWPVMASRAAQRKLLTSALVSGSLVQKFTNNDNFIFHRFEPQTYLTPQGN